MQHLTRFQVGSARSELAPTVTIDTYYDSRPHRKAPCVPHRTSSVSMGVVTQTPVSRRLLVCHGFLFRSNEIRAHLKCLHNSRTVNKFPMAWHLIGDSNFSNGFPVHKVKRTYLVCSPFLGPGFTCCSYDQQVDVFCGP